MSEEWIPLDPDKLSKPIPRSVRGVRFDVFISPYDIPDAVRGYYDEDRKRFVIEFRYLGEEPMRKTPEENHVALRIGKNSGRLYAIETDVTALRASAVALQVLPKEVVPKAVEDAVRNLSPTPNYQAAKDAIEETKDEIFADLATSS